MNKFANLKLGNWRQFENVNLTFHPRLIVPTGANGSGKTTILNILNRRFGWNLQFVGTPQAKRKGLLKYVADVFFGRAKHLPKAEGDKQTIGEIGYTDEKTATLAVPTGEVANEYTVDIVNQLEVPGIFVSSH